MGAKKTEYGHIYLFIRSVLTPPQYFKIFTNEKTEFHFFWSYIILVRNLTIIWIHSIRCVAICFQWLKNTLSVEKVIVSIYSITCSNLDGNNKNLGNNRNEKKYK